MNILPKQYSDFLNKNYWDRFFQKLKEKGEDSEYFEWYGDYQDHSELITKLVAKDASILNIGCGKSLFSEQMYD
jgi:hypothetical protein